MRLAAAAAVALAATAVLVAAAAPTPARPSRHGPALVLSPYHRDPHNAIVAVRTTQALVALTFDDGPDPRYTPHVLQALRAAHAHATFFLIGAAAVREPRLVRAIERQGDEIADHTLDHRRLPPLGSALVAREITGGARAIAGITGRRPTLFRPPYGYFDNRVSALVADAGLRLVGWNLAVERFLHGRTPAQAAAAVARITRPGDILLLHDGGGRRGATLATLRALLPLLHARGLRPVTVSRLLRARGS